MFMGGFEWLWVVRGGYEWSRVVTGGLRVAGGNGWLQGSNAVLIHFFFSNIKKEPFQMLNIHFFFSYFKKEHFSNCNVSYFFTSLKCF